ncbi:hypothetical protein TNCV_781941 [Trichonephila clavipes]|nr:hypothetical protein TNCV_781941 [Trichonephila clavipes]
MTNRQFTLSFCDVATRIDWNPTIVRHIWNLFVQESILNTLSDLNDFPSLHRVQTYCQVDFSGSFSPITNIWPGSGLACNTSIFPSNAKMSEATRKHLQPDHNQYAAKQPGQSLSSSGLKALQSASAEQEMIFELLRPGESISTPRVHAAKQQSRAHRKTRNHSDTLLGFHGSPVAKVTDSWPACHELQPSTAEYPPCRGAMCVKSVEARTSTHWRGV